MMWSLNSIRVKQTLLSFIHFTFLIIYKCQSSCTKLYKFTLRWMTGEIAPAKVRPGLNDIPGPISLPLFGTTLAPETNFADITRNTEDLIEKYGTLVKMELFWNIPLVLVYNASDMDCVLKNASTIRPPIEIVRMYRASRKDRYNTGGIVNTQYDDWHSFRSVLTQSLQIPKYVISMYAICDSITSDLIELLRRGQNGRIENLDEFIVRYTAECAFANVLSKRMGLLNFDPENSMEVFVQSQEKYFKALHTSFYGFPWWKYVPHRVWDELKECEDSTYNIFSTVVEEEKQSGPEGLLKLILASETIHELDKVVFAMDLVMGAIEPVQNSIIFCLHLIASNPEVQEKLYNELLSVLPDRDTPIDQNVVTELHYLKACIQESFRMIPTAPNLARWMEGDIELQGYNIPAGTLLVCQHWHACLQDKNFYRAKEFIPERWMYTLEGLPRTAEFLPHHERLYHFGTGRRDCPGRRFASMEMSIFFAKLFRNFKVELDAPVNVRFEFIQIPELPIHANLTRRPI